MMRQLKLKMLRKSRKAVSPLVATVLLIAFAVALGAVVMNWGKQQVETHVEELEACRDVSMRWYLLNEKEQICYTDSKLVFTVENGVTTNVNDLKLIVVGLSEIYVKDRTRLGLKKGDIRTAELDYELAKYGEPQEIRLIPVIDVDEESVVCSANSALKKQMPERCVS